MKTKVKPTVEKWEEKVGETVEHLVTVIGIGWEDAHDDSVSQKKKEMAYKSACKYARDYIKEVVAQSVQEAKAEEVKRLKDEIQKECQWMKRTQVDGDKFQEGAIHGMDMAIDVLSGDTREKEVATLNTKDELTSLRKGGV